MRLLLYLLSLLFVSPVHATEHKAVHWQNIEFWQGAAAGLLLHELGHVVVGSAYGAKPQLNRGSIVYPNQQFSPSASMQVSSAGFQMQWLVSEWAFADLNDTESAQHLRAQGAIAMHLGISAAYLLKLKDMPTSDIYALSQTSGLSRQQLAAWVAFPAILDAYRLFGDDVPAWVPYLSMGLKAAEASYIWQY